MTYDNSHRPKFCRGSPDLVAMVPLPWSPMTTGETEACTNQGTCLAGLPGSVYHMSSPGREAELREVDQLYRASSSQTSLQVSGECAAMASVLVGGGKSRPASSDIDTTHRAVITLAYHRIYHELVTSPLPSLLISNIPSRSQSQ